MTAENVPLDSPQHVPGCNNQPRAERHALVWEMGRMNRDENLVYIAARSNSTVHWVWVHRTGQGWSRRFNSPDVLEAMSDDDLEAKLTQLRRLDQDMSGPARLIAPEADDQGIAEILRENKEDRLMGICRSCGEAIGVTDPGYLVWDAGHHEWQMYCGRHRPREYWREWPSGQPYSGSADTT